ncbi:Peroxisomal biogenesis factor 3 [Eumeta japonica]|uniref:Peroxisomal biogenesis factor 3 n=1 Tax=Eumeta variegata TaxID=151549 RepID=A0A4C1YU68_EUMVA|nr:Peroxisomal biogenesis factor 3 [Eumeta japonica]
MFSAIKNFLHRHRRKFIVTSAVIGGAYLLSRYAQRKLREWQEREAKKFLEMTRKKQHFESTERTCNQTIISLSKIVSESILNELNTEELVKKLQETPENKVTLWEQIKIMIFTRICVLVYALCILQVTLRVQLNIIGGYLYKDSVHEEAPLIDSALQAKYLSLCHHFVSQGVGDLIRQIEKAVKRVVGQVSLKKKITLQEVEQLFWSIQTILCTDSLDSNPVRQMVNYLIGHADLSDPKLNTIVQETMDVLESDEITSLTMSSISRSFSVVMDEIANLFASKATPITKNQLEEISGDGHIVTNGALKLGIGADTFVDVNKVDIHLVKLLPILNDLITKNNCKTSTNIPDLLTQQLTVNDKLKVLGANIYEVFSSV